MKVAICVDANSAYTREMAKEEGFFFLDMPVIIDGENFIQGVNLSSEDFYEALAAGKNVTTSQPAPGVILDFWDSIFAQGYEQIVHIPMSSGLSTACDTATMLADDYDGKVQVVDNHRISVTLTSAALDAKRMVEKGYDAKQIKDELEKAGADSGIYIAVDTLEYLKKGGRVTPAGAALGTLLGIKPILSIRGGKLDAYAKVRGTVKAKSKIVEAIKTEIEERFPDVPKEKISIFTADTLMTAEEEAEWSKYVSEAFSEYGEIVSRKLSLSIGTHIGPGGFAAAYAIKLDV